MGLALLIVVLKTMALRTGNELYNQAARFWAKIFGINFVMGVVTGIPMEFQFGTNWAQFSRVTGGVIGQPLAMEGVFSFFLESAFLGLFLYGERRLSRSATGEAALQVFVGSWMSGFFIIVTDAWMQHPVGVRAADGTFRGDQLLGPAAESVGADAVFPQHVRGGDDRRHSSWARSAPIICWRGSPPSTRDLLCAWRVWSACIACVDPDLPDRRPAWPLDGLAPARHHGRDGRPVHSRSRGAHRADGPARTKRQTHRQSDRGQQAC